MRKEKEDRILIIHLEPGDSLAGLKDEILDSAKKEEVYAIAFVITKEWKFDADEADTVSAWMKKIPFLTIIAFEDMPNESNKIFSLYGEYRLVKSAYTIDLSKADSEDLKSRYSLLYGSSLQSDECVEIPANVEEDTEIKEAVLAKGKEWFKGKTSAHIEMLIAFYKNFNENLSEEELLSLESHTFCELINGEQVNMP